jgi:arylsulfatase A-like enzyme
MRPGYTHGKEDRSPRLSRGAAAAVILLACLACGFRLKAQGTEHGDGKPNILFIFVDDLRPDLGCYGDTVVRSPHIDSLAAHGTVFTREYVTVPTCGASRCSILTGLLPRGKELLSNEACRLTISGKPRTDTPETFVDNLRRHGYYTVGIGKISHYPDGYVYGYTQPVSRKLELPYSWDEMLLDDGQWGTGWNAFFGYAAGTNRNTLHKEVKPYEAADVGDDGYPDGLTADLAMRKLTELDARRQPFFLAVGFFKPHLPFNAPKKYWDLYEESKIPLTPSPDVPAHVSKASLNESAEFNQYKLGEEKASLEKPLSPAYQRKLKHGYYACVSYVDAQIGKVLDRLKTLGLDRNTIVILWGDHGWHLGDDRVWGKHTLFEWAVRSPLIISLPGGKGACCAKVVSTIDLYPTLMQLTGIPMPYKTAGKSLVPLLRRPGDKDWKQVAYSYFNHGISMRTGRYRLTRYFRKQQPVIELYDHKNDPYENTNVAASHPAVVRRLMPLLEKGNTGLYGPGTEPAPEQR